MFKLGQSIVIGMIHVPALPGTPANRFGIEKIIKIACKDAEVYTKCQLDGVLVENMHDVPYLQSSQLGPEVTSSMTAVCSAVRAVLPANVPCGVQILAGGNKQALAVALAARLDFVRVEGFVFSHVADEGLMHACAGELLRYRRHIGATGIHILTDIKKKHCAHTITSDVSLEETAKAAEFFSSDGLIVTGSSTGDPASPQDCAAIRRASSLPVIVGSGVTAENFHQYLGASGFIIGSHFKHEGRWQNELSEERVTRFMENFHRFKENHSQGGIS